MTIDQYADAVDLRIFLDLLQKISRFEALEGHIYAARSGYTMTDHKLMHRELGIEKLLAFDEDEELSKRQRFNKPTSECRCTIRSLDEFCSDPTTVIEEENFNQGPMIVWIKEARWHKLSELLRHFETLVSLLQPMSIVRVTIAADILDWAGREPDLSSRRTISRLREDALEQLRSQLGDYIDPSFGVSNMQQNGFGSALSEAFGVAADRAVPTSGTSSFEPLSLVEFDSETKMLSLTGMIVPEQQRDALHARLTVGHWPFLSNSWSDVKGVLLPDLTVRERLTLEFYAGQGKAAADDGLRFDIDVATEKPGFFENFAAFHRYYPVLLSAEL